MKDKICCNKDYLMGVCPCYKKGLEDGDFEGYCRGYHACEENIAENE